MAPKSIRKSTGTAPSSNNKPSDDAKPTRGEQTGRDAVSTQLNDGFRQISNEAYTKLVDILTPLFTLGTETAAHPCNKPTVDVSGPLFLEFVSVIPEGGHYNTAKLWTRDVVGVIGAWLIKLGIDGTIHRYFFSELARAEPRFPHPNLMFGGPDFVLSPTTSALKTMIRYWFSHCNRAANGKWHFDWQSGDRIGLTEADEVNCGCEERNASQLKHYVVIDDDDEDPYSF